MPITKDILIQRYLEALESYNACIFAGAGLSLEAGVVDWRSLLKGPCEELGLDVNKETDLVSVAQYYKNKKRGRGRLNDILVSNFCRDLKPTKKHETLASLPIQIYWTTNYDNLIENSLKNARKIPDVKYTKDHLAKCIPGRDTVVYKMHGDCEHPNEAVLTRFDYEEYHLKMEDYLAALKGDLLSKTFLFLGFSFTDPNIEYILSRVRISHKNQKEHYCIMKEVTATEEDFEYKKIKQQLFIEDLEEYSVYTHLVKEYHEITDILKEIEQLYKQKSIFISGSAETYNYELFNEMSACKFIYDLSAKIISEKCRIINGFGLGIGSHVINGALSDIYADNSNSIKDQLVLRPFPQGIEDKNTRDALWKKYRQDMISKAGIAIFLFGNKKRETAIIEADGVRKEFEIAKEKGLKLIPVGATGYMSKTLWEEVNNTYNTFYPSQTSSFRSNFDVIGNPRSTPDQIISSLINMTKELNRR